MASADVNYYEVLGISPKATQDEIRKAYKVQALKTHPDRVPANHPDRPSRTRQFQVVNDAYYTLSDPVRRRDYDATRPAPRASRSRTDESGGWAGSNPGFAGGEAASGRPSGGQWQDEQFGEFFEEMMGEEGMRDEVQEGTGRLWGIIGAISGAILGYIIYDMTGLLLGLGIGNRLGAVRDRKGKSVYAVFQEMPQSEKMRILSELAARVLAGAMSS